MLLFLQNQSHLNDIKCYFVGNTFTAAIYSKDKTSRKRILS